MLAEAALVPARFDETSSKFGDSAYDEVKAKFAGKLDRAINDYSRGNLSQSELEGRFQAAIAGSYSDAYRSGLDRWGRSDLSKRDEQWLRRAVSGEAKYARNFAADIASGAVSPSQAANRAGMYADSLDSVRTNGWVEGSPDGTVFVWELGVARHCNDCPSLAMASPYTKEDLPTVPRAGDTQCQSRCACHLRIESGGGVLPKTALESPDKSHGTNNLGREPTGEERAQIDELRSRLNYWRREIDRSDTPEERASAIAERRAANAALIDLVQGKGIREVPLLSVGEVLTARDARPEAVDAILERGIDGTTLDLLSEAGFSKGLRELLASHAAYLRPGK